jgi:hypothetical protein
LYANAISFTGFHAGTVEVSLGLHASRQLSGKVLRYLKRVIVTPAVYRSVAPLERSLRYRHWAGFSGNTHPSGLAATCVFIKQSGFPSYCDQPFSRLAPLIPKVRGDFAEFPRVDCLPTRLGLLTQGHLCQFLVRTQRLTASTFSWAPGIGQSPITGPTHRLIPCLAITALRGIIGLDRTMVLNGLSRCVGASTATAVVQEY